MILRLLLGLHRYTVYIWKSCDVYCGGCVVIRFELRLLVRIVKAGSWRLLRFLKQCLGPEHLQSPSESLRLRPHHHVLRNPIPTLQLFLMAGLLLQPSLP